MANAGVPLTGHFINCRGSMINWCPIGRNANKGEREEFIKLDEEESIRKRVIDELKAMLKVKGLSNKVTLKLGGDTSFDIYPKGWDKTYGLKHFPGWTVWFVGDRCEKEGNDYELYDYCFQYNRAFKTKGPKETVDIVNMIIKKIQGNNEA